MCSVARWSIVGCQAPGCPCKGEWILLMFCRQTDHGDASFVPQGSLGMHVSTLVRKDDVVASSASHLIEYSVRRASLVISRHVLGMGIFSVVCPVLVAGWSVGLGGILGILGCPVMG